jgi:hypothetical protein
MTKNNTADTSRVSEGRIPWPVEDCIRWVEWRIRELTIRRGKYVDERGRWLLEEKAAGGRKLVLGDKVADYAVWLLKVRDGLSWHQLAYRFFPHATEENIGKYKLKVRRARDRVESNHRGSKKFNARPLSRQDKLLLQAVMLGVTPVYISAMPNSPRSDLQS